MKLLILFDSLFFDGCEGNSSRLSRQNGMPIKSIELSALTTAKNLFHRLKSKEAIHHLFLFNFIHLSCDDKHDSQTN